MDDADEATRAVDARPLAPGHPVLLALAVLHDLDALPVPGGGLVVSGGVGGHADAADVDLEPDEVAELLIIGAGPPGDPRQMAAVLARWIRLRRADPCDGPPLERLRPLALPRGHVRHLGPAWIGRTVLGDAVDLGPGLRWSDDDAGRDEPVLPLGPAMAGALGLDPGEVGQHCERLLAHLGALATAVHRAAPDRPLRPVGDADVVTLLADAGWRAALAAGDRTGMRSAAVPVRRRGWLDLRRLDPSFSLGVAAATMPAQRGFARPVLVTADEVVLVRAGSRPDLGHDPVLDLRDRARLSPR